MPFEIPITDLREIERPIVQGGMHNMGVAELTNVVPKAGGVGILIEPIQHSPDAVRDETDWGRAMTGKSTVNTCASMTQFAWI